MGAWIEIINALRAKSSIIVAPYMGAWIEIDNVVLNAEVLTGSLPTWERGLKLRIVIRRRCRGTVAPYMGAWIEIFCRETM